jgi:hypothetical protein
MLFFFPVCVGIDIKYQAEPLLVQSLNSTHAFDGIITSTPPNGRVILAIFSKFDIFSRFTEPIYEQAAHTFGPDRDLRFLSIDGDNVPEICQRYKITEYPKVLVFEGAHGPETGPVAVFPGNDPYNMNLLVEFINLACKKTRTIDGRLLPGVGVDTQIEPLIKEFFQFMDKRDDIICTLKTTHPVYARALQLVINFGEQMLKEEKRRISMLVTSTWPSADVLDREQVFLHVLTHLIELSKGDTIKEEVKEPEVASSTDQDAHGTETVLLVQV